MLRYDYFVRWGSSPLLATRLGTGFCRARRVERVFRSGQAAERPGARRLGQSRAAPADRPDRRRRTSPGCRSASRWISAGLDGELSLTTTLDRLRLRRRAGSRSSRRCSATARRRSSGCFQRAAIEPHLLARRRRRIDCVVLAVHGHGYRGRLLLGRRRDGPGRHVEPARRRTAGLAAGRCSGDAPRASYEVQIGIGRSSGAATATPSRTVARRRGRERNTIATRLRLRLLRPFLLPFLRLFRLAVPAPVHRSHPTPPPAPTPTPPPRRRRHRCRRRRPTTRGCVPPPPPRSRPRRGRPLRDRQGAHHRRRQALAREDASRSSAITAISRSRSAGHDADAGARRRSAPRP